MGFDFISPKPISCDDSKKRLLKDIYNKGIKKRRVPQLALDETIHIPSLDTIDDNPMTDVLFLSEREKILDSWPTDSEVRDADIKKIMRLLLKTCRYSQSRNCRPLIQPRAGVAHTCDEIEMLTFLRQKGLDISSIQLDAASRKNIYDKAPEGVLRTEKGKQSFLNGYPVPVHGVKGVEEIVHPIDNPFQIRAGSPDHHLVYEIGLAGGASPWKGDLFAIFILTIKIPLH